MGTSSSLAGVQALPAIDWHNLEEGLADLEGIGQILHDLSVAAESNGEVHPRSLFFLGTRVLEIQRQIDRATTPKMEAAE